MAAVAADPLAGVPEKYQVKGADGKLDAAATLAKVDAARAALEGRMGAGGLPPETPEGYKPETVYEALKTAGGGEFKLPDEFLSSFNQFAHDAKLSQGQYDKALTGMLGMTKNMVSSGFEHAMATGREALTKVWGPDAANPKSPRMQSAHRAFMKYVPETLRNAETRDAIGNHPVVMQLLEAVGRDLKEDVAPNSGDGGATTGRLDQIFADPAYWNPRDPKHGELIKEAQKLFSKGETTAANRSRPSAKL